MYRLKSMIEAIKKVQNEEDQKMRAKCMLGVALCVLFAVSYITFVESARAEEPLTPMVFTDPLTVQTTDVGQEFVVNINVSNVVDLYAWQAGLTFNPEVLECTGFFEGEFLKSHGPTNFVWSPVKDMNNTLGIVYYRGACLVGPVAGVNGSGQLAYATFTSVGIGLSNLYLTDVILVNSKIEQIPFELNKSNEPVSKPGTDPGTGNNPPGGSNPGNSTSAAVVFTDPLAVQATDVGQEFVVDINVSNVVDLYAWQTGITFNPDVLECTGFFEGEFLKSQGPTWFIWPPDRVNNTLGIVYYGGAVLWGPVPGVNGSGQLAYATFTSVGIGISDFHLTDVILVNSKIELIPFEVHESVTVSISGTDYGIGIANNLTGESSPVNAPLSGMFNAAFNATEKNVSFDVSSVNDWYLEMSVPKSLLKSSTPSDWTVKVDNVSIPYTVNENVTHTFLYFEHPQGSYAVEIIGTEVPDISPPPIPPLPPVPPVIAIPAVPHGAEVTPPWTRLAPPWMRVADISAPVRAVPQVAIVLIAVLGLASLIFAVLDIERTRKTLDQRTATPPSNSSF